MKVNNTLSFNGSVTNYENLNDSFFRTKIRVFAFGNNRNGSNFSPESFVTAQQSMSLIPIVAKYNADEDDLEGHNVNLKKNNSGEYEFHFDTYPIGVVSPDSNITLEEVNEGSDEFPDMKTYVVVDNIYLWKRYEATKKIISWIEEGVSPKVSMEIDGVTGKFSDDGYFQIDSFQFSAIAALGSEIEPCFKKAEIEAYSKQDFKSEFKALVYELNETLKQDGQGGTKMTEETKTQESPETEVEAEFEALVDETTETQAEEVVTEMEAPKEDEAKVEDVPESDVKAEDEDADNQLQEAPEEVQAEQVEQPKEEIEVVDYEAKFNELHSEFTSLQSQLDELKSYKRNREEDDIKSQFADKLSDEEMTEVFTAMKEASIEDVEVKLFAMYGKKNFTATKSTQVKETNKVTFSLPKDTIDNPYGDIFEK